MSTVDEIKQRLDIVDIVGGYLRIEKAGHNFKALCPFHQEKTPSFFVFPDRQSWRCFGCGSGGDLFSFVMRKEGIAFGEALKMLAEKAGVSLDRQKEAAGDRPMDRLYQINEAAACYYHDVLLNDSMAQLARDYVKKRGLAPKTIADFQLGFSLGEDLKKHLLQRGYGEEELITVGLLREGEGRTYDLFRHRLMFPIRNIKGKLVGFGARALDDSLPKYLNSPQTAVFDKGGVLYGIDRAKGTIRERGLAVIVEGYMDVVTAHQHGTANVVASMGTALTDKQVKVLRGLTRSLAFALDSDAAGNAATLRGIEVARRSLDREHLEMPTWLGTTSKLRAEMKIISLPQGKDPDALIREDPQAWQQLVDRASPLVDHIIAAVTSKLDLTRPEGKSQASQQLLPIIAELEDDVEREFYLGKLASLVGVSERTLAGMAARIHRTRRERVAGTEAETSPSARYGDPLEEYCLSLLLQHPELRDRSEGLLPDHFERSENREVFLAWRGASNPEELLQRTSVDLQEHLGVLAGRVLPPASDTEWEAALADCIRRLEERRLKNLKIQEESFLSDAESEGRGEAISALQQMGVEINVKLKEAFETARHMTSANREDQ